MEAMESEDVQRSDRDRRRDAMGMRGLVAVLVAVAALAAGPACAESGSLDFGWSKPVAPHIKGKKSAPYLVWPIQIVNNSTGVLTPSLGVVAVTNTGHQYIPLPFAAVAPDAPYEELYTLDGLHTQMFPRVTRRAVAVFEKVDPKAQEIRFYVSGLVRPGPRRTSGGTSYVLVTFERVKDDWQWVSTEFLE
jgi:hypothetical protein